MKKILIILVSFIAFLCLIIVFDLLFFGNIRNYYINKNINWIFNIRPVFKNNEEYTNQYFRMNRNEKEKLADMNWEETQKFMKEILQDKQRWYIKFIKNKEKKNKTKIALISWIEYELYNKKETDNFLLHWENICFRTKISKKTWEISEKDKLKVTLVRYINKWWSEKLETKEIFLNDKNFEVKWSLVWPSQYYLILEKEKNSEIYFDREAIIDSCD